MSARRPAAAPGLIAALTAAVPARLVRKLDGAPGTAEGWTWDLREDGSGTVTTDGGERVALSPEAGRLSAPSQIACSCLLAPRCLHLLAVLIALPVDAAAVDPAAGGAAPGQAGGEGSAPQAGTASGEVTTAQREAASVARRALGEVLAAGAQGAGVVLQAEVLRAVHACRAANLPRLSALLLTVSSGIRACREESADFELEGFARSLGEALRVARALGRPAVDGEDLAALVGLARRAYAEAGSLRLYGLFSEPILTASGYGGVVTTFLGPGGELFSASDVVPGGPERIAGAYAGGARLGGGTLSHRELGRSGLHVEGATTSPEGRLGAGQGVRAVSAGPSRWAEAAAAVRFDEPLRAQLDRALGGDGSSPSGTGLLLFFRASVGGLSGEALLLDVEVAPGESRRLEAIPGDARAELPWRENLSRLGGCAGLRLRCVARVVPERAGRVVLLAVEVVDPDGAEARAAAGSLALPPEWQGRCNLGLDRLQGAHLSPAPGEGRTAAVPEPEPDELLPLRRRQQRVALGGRSTLFPAAMDSVEAEARRLERLLLPTAAALLRALAAVSLSRGAGSVDRLADAYLAAHAYLGTARRSLRRTAWEEVASGS